LICSLPILWSWPLFFANLHFAKTSHSWSIVIPRSFEMQCWSGACLSGLWSDQPP
jgi:hypothetical protein